MSYINKVIADYLKTFKVTKSMEFVTSNHNGFKVDTYKLDGVYYAKFSRAHGVTGEYKFYQENHAGNKEDFKKVVSNVVYYLNTHS